LYICAPCCFDVKKGLIADIVHLRRHSGIAKRWLLRHHFGSHRRERAADDQALLHDAIERGWASVRLLRPPKGK
jgi:hypothetical protein